MKIEKCKIDEFVKSPDLSPFYVEKQVPISIEVE